MGTDALAFASPSLPAALSELVHTYCWPPGVPAEDIAKCCERPSSLVPPSCFNELYSYEACCIKQDTSRPGSADEGADVPLLTELPWELDAECASMFIDPSLDVTHLQYWWYESRQHWPYGCSTQRIAQWDGRFVHLSASVKRNSFFVVDLSHCLWGDATCANFTRLLQARTLIYGNRWLPPEHVTAALVGLPTRTTPVGRLAIQVIPLVRYRKGDTSRSRQSQHRRRAGLNQSRGLKQALGHPSVYLLTLDSVSRSSLRWAMPRTYEFLTRAAGGSSQRGATAPSTTPRMPSSHTSVPFSRYHTLYFGGTLAQMFPFFFGGLALPCAQTAVKQESNGILELYNISRALQECAAFPAGGALGELKQAGYEMAVSFTDVGFGTLARDAIEWDHVLPYAADALRSLFRIPVAEGDTDFVCTGLIQSMRSNPLQDAHSLFRTQRQ